MRHPHPHTLHPNTHPRCSVEEVSSSPGTDDTQELRQWMDGIDFCGGGVGETLALAPAVLAGASLLARPI